MTDLPAKVRALSRAAFRLRVAAPPRTDLPPFALCLFTDDRRGPALQTFIEQIPAADAALPPVAVIFRHYGLPEPQRRALARLCKEQLGPKGHILLTARLSGPPLGSGHHGPRGRAKDGLWTAPVHDLAEGRGAKGADAAFVSPVFVSASHPNTPPLGPHRARAIAAAVTPPAFALGGIDARCVRRLIGMPFYGFGAIGAFDSATVRI